MEFVLSLSDTESFSCKRMWEQRTHKMKGATGLNIPVMQKE